MVVNYVTLGFRDIRRLIYILIIFKKYNFKIL